ncbi:MAG: septal ring lytic transglycosylase RlpA family protein [Gammaproteobacteria bacterium]|nr:septal ring lytic transglycosylase RlpA family protein [Gammaproteobacteria bacterium]
MRVYRQVLAWLVAALVLSACTGHAPLPEPPAGWGKDYPPDAVPKVEPKSRYGNPAYYDVAGRRYDVLDSSEGFVERGMASWYGADFQGRRASSGETYDMYAMTAAHPSLPLPTYVHVTNLDNGRETVVKVNDRGPFHDDRVIDLSYAAAYKLGIVQRGTALVEVRALSPGAPQPEPAPVVATPPQAVQTAATSLPDFPALFVQVGAFAELRNAEALRAQLLPAELGDIQIGGNKIQTGADGPLYRVRIGPLSSAADADRTARRVQALGLYDARVVAE